jgi:hypothetical protein
MKKLVTLFVILATTLIGYAQTCPTPTTSGVFVTLDSNYQLAPSAVGFTNVGLCFYNNTTTLITATQFRVYYDKLAFSGINTVTSLNTSYSQYLQYVDNPSLGFVTITLSYTGSLSSFEIPDGAFVQLKLNHITGFSTLSSVDNMSFSGVNTFPSISTNQDGTDNTLTLQNFGGVMSPQTFSFSGTFTNVTGTGAKNLTVGLEKKLRPNGSWTPVTSVLSNNSGVFAFSNIAVDTTGYDVRIKIVGDTMLVGNVISTADAQKVNDYVLGTQTPTGFDYYTADVNGDNNLTISDAYGVFGRISGRFSVWPNSVKDVKFFTSSEYETINGSSTNYLSSIFGTTNFTFNIIEGASSPTFYVLVPGDANGTGYHMARVTPIEVLITPQPGVESQIYNVIDTKVDYDFPTTSIEVNVPHLSVQEGSLVNIPIKVLTNGVKLGSLQFGLKYNDTLLDFKGIDAKSSASSWLTYLNTNDNEISWGGYDVSSHLKPLNDGDEVVTLKFITKQPQDQWTTSPLWTTNKFAGNNTCKDLTITPTNGILQVYKLSNPGVGGFDDMTVFPNPTDDYINVKFEVKEYGPVKLSVYGINGVEYKIVVNDKMPMGDYQYETSLGNLTAGVYIAVLKRSDKQLTNRIILK